MEFNATLKPDGKLTIHRRKTLDSWLASLATEEDQGFILTIEKKKKSRSAPANRYYWGVVVTIFQRGLNEAGYDVNKEETHAFIMANFGYSEIVDEDTGEVFRNPGKTSKMSSAEFWGMINKAVRFAAEHLHEVIPMPNEQAEIDFKAGFSDS